MGSKCVSYLRRSDVFVFSSKREGFGYVLLEAMSQGLPVISSNTPYGPSEILNNGKYGIIVPVGNVALLKKAILKLLIEDKVYKNYSKKSIERSIFFSKDKMINDYKKVLISLNK